MARKLVSIEVIEQGDERHVLLTYANSGRAAKDGSLLVADDTGGTIWRISYTGSQEEAGALSTK
jgi:hypothetical protein